MDSSQSNPSVSSNGQGEAAATNQAAISRAFYDGAMAAIGRRYWDDAADFFALVGQGYARGEPYPATMPKLATGEDK